MAIYDLSNIDKNFSTHFKILRSFYELSVREMAELLNYKSPSNINYFENIPLSNRPSYQVLIYLQQLYGISVDWLFGIHSLPFTEKTLKAAENTLTVRLNSLSLNFTDKKFAIEQRLQKLLSDLTDTNTFVQFTLNDRFVLLFLINFLNNKLCKAYSEIEIDQKEKYSKFTVIDNNKIIIRKHPEFIPLLELFHQEKNTTHNTTILEPHWDFISFSEQLPK